MKYKIRYNIIYSLLTAAVLSYALSFILTSSKSIFTKEYVLDTNFALVAVLTLIFGGGFFTFFHLTKKIHREFLIYAVFLYGFQIAFAITTTPIYFTLVIVALIAWLVFMFKEIWPNKPFFSFFEGKTLYIVVGALTVLMIWLVSWGTILRYSDFTASTFDFGIFTQMYESMATDFTQNTTLERNQLLSHFSVHFSPIYYLLLPFYMIFRCPEFLLVAQAVIVYSTVIPLLLLCKKFRYSGKLTFLIAVTFLSLMSMLNPCFYDFHENAFLPPLLLWLFYFLEKDSSIGVLVSSVLTLCVKEDAGLYIIIIAVYALLEKRYSKRTTIGLLILGVAGFIGATSFINAFGESIKTDRYSTFLNEGETSLVSVAMNVIKNPAYFIQTLLSPEKLIFLIQMLLPLGFVPFRTRKFHSFILFLPLILVNLATTYPYQFDIGYQYVLASGICLVFLFIRNIRYFRRPVKIAAICAMTSILVTTTYMSGIYKYHMEENAVFAEENAVTAQALAELHENNEDASILSTTYLTPHLYKHDTVYMYPCETPTDIVILDCKPGHLADYDTILSDFAAKGYVLQYEKGWATVLFSAEYAAHSLTE